MAIRGLKSVLAALFIAAIYVPILLYVRSAVDDSPDMILCDLLGLIALSLLVCAVMLTARIRPLTRTIKLVQIVWTHKFLGSVTIAFVLIHIALVLWDDPSDIRLLNPWQATPASRAATAATLALLGLAAMSRLRGRRPELWRWLHIVFAAGALVLAGLHVYWLNHLIKLPEMRAWFIVCASAALLALADRWVFKPLRYFRQSYRVTQVVPESSTTSTVVLSPTGSRHGRRQRRDTPWFHPGQYAWLRLHAVPTAQERPFTICSSAHNSQELRFTIRTVGEFSQRLSQLNRGRRVWLDGPHGAFRVPSDSVGTVSIVAGVGITPVMSILRTMADRGDRRPHRLLVGARFEEDLLFRRELEQIRSRLNLSVTEVLTRPTAGWIGETGRISQALLSRFVPSGSQRKQMDYFVCGPQEMAVGVAATLVKLGVPSSRINVEYLSGPAKPVKKSSQGSTSREASKSDTVIRVTDLGPRTDPIGIRVGAAARGQGTGSHRLTPGSGPHRVVPPAAKQR